MALVLKNREIGGPGSEVSLADLRVDIVNVQLDNAYPTGGTPGVKAALGFAVIYALIPLQHYGYILEYYPETDKLKIYNQPAAAAAGAMPELANATNLSATVLRMLVLGQ